jgi:hypothetical protein
MALANGAMVCPADILKLSKWLYSDTRQIINSIQLWVQFPKKDYSACGDIHAENKTLQVYETRSLFERYLGFADILKRTRSRDQVSKEDELLFVEHTYELGLNVIFEEYLLFFRVFFLGG